MNIDEQIAAKEKEIQENHNWISKSEFLGEVTYGQPMKINDAKDLIEYTIRTKTEELLTIEHELLLDIKYPNNVRSDHDSLEKNADALRKEIADLKNRLKR